MDAGQYNPGEFLGRPSRDTAFPGGVENSEFRRNRYQADGRLTRRVGVAFDPGNQDQIDRSRLERQRGGGVNRLSIASSRLENERACVNIKRRVRAISDRTDAVLRVVSRIAERDGRSLQARRPIETVENDQPAPISVRTERVDREVRKAEALDVFAGGDGSLAKGEDDIVGIAVEDDGLPVEFGAGASRPDRHIVSFRFILLEFKLQEIRVAGWVGQGSGADDFVHQKVQSTRIGGRVDEEQIRVQVVFAPRPAASCDRQRQHREKADADLPDEHHS